MMPFVFSLIGVIIFHYFDEIFGGILIWLSLLFADITNLFIIKEEYWLYDDDNNLLVLLAGGLRAALVVFISLCFLNVDSSYFTLMGPAFIMGFLYSIVPLEIRSRLLHL